ncbi:DUF3500 domain-containing protein [Actinoplanes sp. NPDC051851]|uniref:DUF3500 domain-containing protein n=1 Tax=Actinoplanes sp. NPDC051851 TaxID=3154753 RepID=UPI003432586A
MKGTRARSILISTAAVLSMIGATATINAYADDTGTTTTEAATDTTPAIVEAADAFLATLTDDEEAAVLFDWSNTDQKTKWSNLPQGLYTRDGLMWGDMSTEAQDAWLALMQATLSDEGYEQVREEWRADDELGDSGPCCYGQEYYWVALIGTPSETDPWQWQWGGHHVTVNATVAGSELALYPSFIGAQPTSYDDDGTTVEPLGDVWDAAFAVVDSLDDAQKSEAVIGDEYIDLLYGPGEDDKEPVYEGVPASELTDAQKDLLLALISEYSGLANDEDAATRTAEIEDTLDETYFAWSGPTTDTGDSYFRVTGPRVIIEYSPQAMGGDAANHIHGIYRDPANDYGAAITG